MMKKQSSKAGLPIVQVQQLRLPWQVQRQMRSGFGEKNKTLGIIRIIDPILLVKSRALIKIRLVNEVNGQARNRLENKNFTPHPSRAESKVQWQIEALKPWEPLTNAQIKRSNHAHFMAKLREGLGQRSRHIRQPARFGKMG